MKKLLVILLLIPHLSYAAFSLPADRTITWTGNAGVSGGIPTNYTQCGETITSTGDTTNRTTTIQNAINACSSGTYVLLGPGGFTITALSMRSGVALRGSGMGITTLRPSSAEYIKFGAYPASFGSTVGLTSALTKGATSITTASNHGMEV